MHDDPVCRTVAQLAEHRSPKPGVGGSIPSCPASFRDVEGRKEARGWASGMEPATKRWRNEASLSEAPEGTAAKPRRRAPSKEHRSPKPGVGGSIPSCPASLRSLRGLR